MSKPSPGLRKRGRIWHIDKIVAGQRVSESTGETELAQAEQYLAKRIREIRSQIIYGERPARTFDQAAARYLQDHGAKKSIDRDIVTLKSVMPYIGDLALEQLHQAAIDRYLTDRKVAGISAGTMIRDLAVIKRILTLASGLWRDEQGRPWLDSPPILSSVKGEARKPRPITHQEQSDLFGRLPAYLAEMALMAVNTGMRDKEICFLSWDWEYRITGIDASLFVIPSQSSKNGRERIVPLNSTARSIIESRRGLHPVYVFAHRGRPITRMTNRAWNKARHLAGLETVRVHDLRHTFGMRLRAAGVSLEDRQDLLGHYSGRITTHYSRAEITHLIDCVEKLCDRTEKPEIALIKAS